MTADVMISLPSFSLSGIPAEVVMINTPYRMRARAIPPPRLVATSRMFPTSFVPSPISIQPMAVLILFLLLSQKGLADSALLDESKKSDISNSGMTKKWRFMNNLILTR